MDKVDASTLANKLLTSFWRNAARFVAAACAFPGFDSEPVGQKFG